MVTVGYVVLVLFLVLANGFFVAAEFALVGVRRSRVETVAAGGDLRARRLLTLLDNLNAYISATQLACPLQVFYNVFRWPIRLLDWSGTRVVRLFGLHPSHEHASVYTEKHVSLDRLLASASLRKES